jgi:CDP-glucose 4,6-dehydratase
VFLTGHTGFKGSWLAHWLVLMGAEVTGYALEPYTAKDNYVVSDLDASVDSVIADVRNAERLAEAVSAARPEIVIHMAAQPLVRYSYEHPSETYEVNVLGTANLLDAVRETGSVAATIVVTSDKCYRNNEWTWGYRETDALGGHDPYSSSKAAAELLVDSYRSSFFAPDDRPLASVRAGNVIGGGDWAADRLVPDIARALIAGDEIAIRNPASTRPWQHVLEPLGGYLLLGAKLLGEGTRYAEAWNFGPSDDANVSVGAVADMMVEAWGGGRWEHTGETGAVHEAGLLALDCSKARHLLGWRPVLTVREAVGWTAEWYKTSVDAPEMRSVGARHIEAYEALVNEAWV